MRQSLSAAAVLLLLALPQSLCADSVLTATGKNFDSIIQDNPFVLFEWYAGWCGHCKKLAPDYEKAAVALKGSDPRIVLAKMEATEEENKAVAAKYGVQGYPTLKIFRGDADSPQEYKGPRDADGIVAYLRKQAGPAFVQLKTEEEVASFKEKEAAVLGVFKAGSASEKTFAQVADALRDDLEFGIATSAPGLKAPSVGLFKQYDDRELVYEGKLEAPALKQWLLAKTLPLVAQLDQSPRNARAVQEMFAKPSVRVVGVVDKGHKQEAAMEEALQASARQNEAYSHLLIDSKANAQALNFFGLAAKDLPVYLVHDAVDGRDDKYISKKAKPASLDAFLGKFKSRKLERNVKSEDAPASNDGPVKVVTANTFDQLVYSGKSVLLEFYAPWCGHCKSLAPIYEEVGKAFSKNKSVTVAKMDATANDVPKAFEVSGFPTLKLVKPDRSIVSYSGDRSQEDLISFVEKALAGGSPSGTADNDEL